MNVINDNSRDGCQSSGGSDRIVRTLHIWREGNGIIDCLANAAIDATRNRLYRSREDLPIKAKGALRLKKLGLPYLQMSKLR